MDNIIKYDYFGYLPRKIFLHFINREAHYYNMSREMFIKTSFKHYKFILLLSIFYNMKMTVNITQMIEHAEGREELIKLAIKFSERGVIQPYSSAPSYQEMIDSRRNLYSELKSRYDFYFNDEVAQRSENIPILGTNESSMTNKLTSLFYNIVSYQLPIIFSIPLDNEYLSYISKDISGILIAKEGIPITTDSLILKGLNVDDSDRPRLSRIITSAYDTAYYNMKEGLVWPTGAYAANIYNDKCDDYPFFDLNILAATFKEIFGNELFNKCLDQSFVDSVLEGFDRIHHRRFVFLINTLFLIFYDIAYKKRREKIGSNECAFKDEIVAGIRHFFAKIIKMHPSYYGNNFHKIYEYISSYIISRFSEMPFLFRYDLENIKACADEIAIAQHTFQYDYAISFRSDGPFSNISLMLYNKLSGEGRNVFHYQKCSDELLGRSISLFSEIFSIKSKKCIFLVDQKFYDSTGSKEFESSYHFYINNNVNKKIFLFSDSERSIRNLCESSNIDFDELKENIIYKIIDLDGDRKHNKKSCSSDEERIVDIIFSHVFQC